ncbi:hypothetical protein ACKKBG_A02255 [Auxenochlorella protothecoides x Auxenochlorella symbiontica]
MVSKPETEGSRPSVLHRQAPDEVTQPITNQEYQELREMSDMREPYRIPGEYLLGCKKYVGNDLADTPLIAFINGRSGGQMGTQLLTVLSRSLGQSQVFDLSEDRPEPVLRTLWSNLMEREAKGDKLAAHIRRNLRVLCAGGDGTVTWILKTIFDLGLEPAPAVAVLPLGTGNDLALSFGWGNAFLKKWIAADQLYHTLQRYAEAQPRALDAWRITLAGPTPDLFEHLPHSLSLAGAGSEGGGGGGAPASAGAVGGGATEGPDVQGPPGATRVTGMFWNYFSVGLDAEAAYGFHALRESRPWAAQTRVMNQAWYGWYSCTSGWFCAAPPLRNSVRLRGRGGPGGPAWRDIPLPASVRAIVVLNLQSYGGGRDIWGLSDGGGLRQGKRVVPIFSDGLVEVVGFKNGWHTAMVMGQVSNKLHGKRLGQVEELELEFQAHGRVKDEAGKTHMQLDGEPWPQGVPPASSAPLKVLISRAGQSSMLLNSFDMQGPVKVRKLAKRGGTIAPPPSVPESNQDGQENDARQIP